jgi:ketosteroid isomerase-like protein
VTLQQRVKAYFDAVNGERWSDVFAVFHDDAVLLVPAQPEKRGVAEIRRFYEAVPRIFPEHYDDPVLILAEGDAAMAAIHFNGRDAGGRLADFWATDIFRFAEGRIREMRIIFDPSALRAKE